MQIKRFYTYFRSSTSYRLRIALNLKGIVPDAVVAVNLKEGEHLQPAFREINPAAALPALELADGTILTQSMALLEWLEEMHSQPPLLPRDRVLRAQIRALANIMASEMHPINNLRVLKYLSATLKVSDAQRRDWMHHWMHEGFTAAEAMLSVREEGAGAGFAFGESPSLADICLIPQIYNALRFEVEMGYYPQLMRVYHHALRHPAFDAARPEKQPDSTL